MKGNKGWYSRGYLPHRDEPHLTQFITFHEADALPVNVRDSWRDELKHLSDQKRMQEENRRILRLLDVGRGKCYLRQPPVAAIVEDVVLRGHRAVYELHAWSVMPNHVHLLVTFLEGRELGEELKVLKGVAAREVNVLLGRSGTFWFRDYYDRYMRNEDHFVQTRRYIDYNPVKAGLCEEPEEWPFSSARLSERE